MILELIFLLIVIVWVLQCVWPGWSGPLVLTPASLIRTLVGVVVIIVLYLIVRALLASAGIHLP